MVYNAYRIRNYMQGDAMYQNIIFDLGGVVVDYAPREFLVDYFMNEKLEDQLFDITFGSEEWKQLDAGLISRHQRRPCASAGRNWGIRLRWTPF